MFSANSLPRARLCVPVLPPAIDRGTGTITMRPENTLPVDIHQLRSDIDILSEQLNEVRAHLTSSQGRSVDSRLSTTLCSPYSDEYEPTPSPSRLQYPTSPKPATLPRKESLSQHRLSQLGLRTNFPPPKPQRTYAETTCSERSFSSQSTTVPRWNATWTVPDEDLVDEELMTEFLSKAFIEGVCWFETASCLLFLNPFNDLSSQRTFRYSALSRLASHALTHSQFVVLFTGESGGGKSYLSEQFVLSISDRTTRPGGVLSSALHASVSLLHALTSVITPQNNRTSKTVNWWELNVRDSRLHGVKLRHFMSESASKNCEALIFSTIAQQMGSSEKERFRIGGFQIGSPQHSHVRLSDIRNALNILCVPFDDIMRVIAACALLNNLLYYDTEDGVDIENINDMEDAAFLLGISALTLFKKLTSRSMIIHREEISGLKTVAVARLERDSLVSALYTRCVQALIRRSNALLELGNCETSEDGSVNDSGIGMSETIVQTSRIDVVDVPGMTSRQRNTINDLCLNIAAEKSRHFFLENSLQKHGFLNLLDHICDQTNGSMHNFLEVVKERKEPFNFLQMTGNELVVRHYEGRSPISYNMTKMIERNKNKIRKELVNLFDRSSCSFKFVVSLFAADIEAMAQRDQFRPKIMKCMSVDAEQTFSQQFLNKVDTLLKKCAQPNLQIVHCLKTNNSCEFTKIVPEVLQKQIIHWNLTETGRSRSEVVAIPAKVEMSPVDVPELPSERNYVVKDSRKHYFPQRRLIIVDYQDMSSGVFLRAGEIVKAVSFYMPDSYLVENGKEETASVPCRFTDKSPLPTAVFNV